MDSRPNRKNTATSSKMRTTLTFHGYGLQSTAGKCTKIYNARAKPLVCSLNLLFGDVLCIVAVMVR